MLDQVRGPVTFVWMMVVGASLVSGREPDALEHRQDAQPSVMLIVDGKANWPGQAANRIIDELSDVLGSCFALQIVRFDAEPALEGELSRTDRHRERVQVKPRTPMRDVMAAAMAQLMSAPMPHTIVVIAHEQFYPTSISQGRLLELARRSETMIHTISLVSNRPNRNVFRSLGRGLGNGSITLFEALAIEERGYSARETGRQLERTAAATGGRSCVAGSEQSEVECAHTVAAAIARFHEEERPLCVAEIAPAVQY